jgi:hypothetical protein
MPIPLTPVGQNIISSLTHRRILDQIADVVFTQTSPLVYRLYKSGRMRRTNPGMQIEIPIQISPLGTFQWITGAEVLPVTPVSNIINAVFTMYELIGTLTFTEQAIFKNQGDVQVISIVRAGLETLMAELIDNLDAMVWSNTTAQPAQPDSIVNGVDDGTIATTYGGLTRANVPNWSALRTTKNPAAAVTLNDINSMVTNLTYGGRTPTVIFTDNYVYNEVLNALTQFQRFLTPTDIVQDNSLAAVGFRNILVAGVPIVVARRTPLLNNNHQMFFLNESAWHAFTNPQGIIPDSDFTSPVNQAIWSMKVRTWFELCTDQPFLNGVLSGIS